MESDPGREGMPPPVAWTALVAVGAEGLTRLECLGCRCPLDVHQPDAEQPHRMLGTCPACKRWHLVEAEIEAEAGHDRLIVVLLPGARAWNAPAADRS